VKDETDGREAAPLNVEILTREEAWRKNIPTAERWSVMQKEVQSLALFTSVTGAANRLH